MQKTNQDMTSVLSRLQMELKQFQDSNTELLDQNSNQMAALQEPKLNMVDEMGLYEVFFLPTYIICYTVSVKRCHSRFSVFIEFRRLYSVRLICIYTSILFKD